MTRSRATFTAWDSRRWLLVVGTLGWIGSIAVWALQLALQLRHPIGSWLLDWHVYAAAADDLLHGLLYRVPLASPYFIPVESFNYPPLSALAAAPLLPLPDQVAGLIWVILNVAAVGATALLFATCLGVRHAPAWAGVAFAAYTIHPWAWFAVLGNNSPVVLLVVTAFVHEHLGGRSRTAGALLGIAIGMKMWPLALIPLLVRERQWRTLAWTVSVLATVAIGSLLWLGSDALGAAFTAMQTRADVEPGNPVLGLSWLRETFDWWPSWAGYVVAAGLLAVPARGRVGLGLGVLAGMAVVPNLWVHYLPAIVVGLLLITSGLAARRSAGRVHQVETPFGLSRSEGS